MSWRKIGIATVGGLLLFGGTAFAGDGEVRGTRLTPEEALAKAEQWRAEYRDREAAGLVPKFHETDDCILPWVEIDTTSGSGTTTLFGIVNQTSSDNGVLGDVYDVFHSSIGFADDTIPPRGVFPVNLRDIVDPADADPDGVFRGFASFSGASDISCDLYQVNPGDNFAQGDLMFRQSDRCWEADFRYGLGGPFDDTEYNFLVNNPSDDTEDDFMFMAFDLDGNMVDSFSDDLLPDGAYVEHGFLSGLLISSVPDFGYLVVMFAPSTNGGYFSVKVSAEGRYSVGLPGTCRDFVSP